MPTGHLPINYINLKISDSIMSMKSKGINAERELLHRFWKTGEWIAMRAPASGAIKYPVPDLLVGNLSRKLAIECKTTAFSRQYISNEQIQNLIRFSNIFGAEPWVAVKFKLGKESEWFFVNVEDLQDTEGSNYVVSIELAKRKGLLFEEIIGNFL